MSTQFLPLQLLLLTFAAWVNRHQGQIIDYLREENRVLKKQLGDKRLHLTDTQRRRLAAKGKILSRKLLSQVMTEQAFLDPPGHNPKVMEETILGSK